MKHQATNTATPKRRFPQFQDAEGWEETALQNVARPVAERAVNGAGDKVLSLSAEQGVVLQSHYFGKKVAGDNAERYIKIARNDFVYNDRTTKQSVYGTIKRLSNFESGLVSPIYKCFRFTGEENPAFWEYYFESGIHEPQIGRLVNEGARAGRFNISIDKFLSTSVWHPTIPEQQQIAECMTSLDELIAAQSQHLGVLKTHKKGLMQQLFPRAGETLPPLRFPEFQDAPEWEQRELGPMTSKVGSGITPLGGDKNYKANGRPFIRSQNVGWGELILDDVAFIDEDTHQSFSATELQTSDVLLNITGASIGRSAVADARIARGNVNQHVCIIRLNSNALSPVLLNQYLISQYGQKQIDTCQAGGNRQGLNFAQIRSFLIPLPPTGDEQSRVADCLSSVDKLISAHAQKLAALKSHKKGLMQQLFPSQEETQ